VTFLIRPARVRHTVSGRRGARVRARVRKGGHDIPEADIRRRCEHSRLNLVHLLPTLTALRVYDNSAEADPDSGNAPTPWLVLHRARGTIVGPADLSQTPAWPDRLSRRR